jgi:vacuolar-type H+-ATPase subunit H
MLEALNDVLEAEERADRAIEEARREAAELRTAFSDEESAAVRNAQVAADQRVRERIAAYREEYDRRVEHAAQRLRAESQAFAPERMEGFERAVGGVVRLVIGGPTKEPG